MPTTYGVKRDYKPIRIYRADGRYLATTTWARNPKIARVKFAEDQPGMDWRDLRANYAAREN